MNLKDQLSQFTGDDERHNLIDGDGKGQAPSETELQYDYAAPGESALLSLGITYCANWKLPADGISKHAREQVKALAATGLPIGLRSLGQAPTLLTEELHPDVMDVAYLEDVSFSQTAISIKHLIIHDPQTLRGIICPGAATIPEHLVERVYRSTIVYTSLERSCVHKEFVDIFNRLGQVWVPCEANREALLNSGVDPTRVYVIPYPFDPASATGCAPRGKEEVPSGKRFYSIGKWEPRKNQHRLIGGFLLAFSPKEKASLFIKTSPFRGDWANYPNPTDSLAFWLRQEDVRENGWTEENVRSRLRIVDEKLPGEDIEKIHRLNNIYVSASCGEAWDIPAFDAKVAGNLLVHVGYGGSEEYFEPDDICITSEEAPVASEYGWEKEAKWRVASAERVKAALLEATPKAKRILPPEYVRRFSHFAVGLQMRDAIQDLAEELGCWVTLGSVGGFG